MKQLTHFKNTVNKNFTKLLNRAHMTEHTFMIIIAIIIGTVAGFAALGIQHMIKFFSSLSYSGSKSLLTSIINTPWYLKIAIPAIGGALVGPIIYFFAREAKGHGVPEVMQSILMKGGVIRGRVAFVKAIASSITIGTGGSVGREGPIVQIGSSIGSAIGQVFKVSNQRLKTFVGCGAAAGIAAAFNAPIAGTLFAVEIMLKDFAFAQFSPIVISSVMATVVMHHFKGNFAEFKVPSYELTSPYELIFYLLLAVLCAFVGYIFIRVLYFSEDLFDEKIKIPEYLKPVIGGVIIGALAIAFPQIMGVGYESIDNALHGRVLNTGYESFFGGNAIWVFAITLVFIKIFATSITLGSGGSGGIFAPSLFLGAMTGVFFGSIAHKFFPGVTSSPGAYALVAMGGLVAATTHAPITAMIIVFELTQDYRIILPLMITCIISTIISSKLTRESIYTLKLLNRGIHIKDGAEINVMKSLFVKDIFTTNYESIQETNKFNEVVNRVIAGHDPYFPVVNQKGHLTGIISLHDIKESLFDKEMLQDLLIASDIANQNPAAVTPEDNCQTALDKMAENNIQGIPVVDVQKEDKILGMIWRKDILDEYNREIERRDITSSYASKITNNNIDSEVHFMEGYSMTEISIPKQFIGKSIKELNIRAHYGVDILLIRSNTESGSKIKAMPTPDYTFSYSDSIVISGEIGKIQLIKSL